MREIKICKMCGTTSLESEFPKGRCYCRRCHNLRNRDSNIERKRLKKEEDELIISKMKLSKLDEIALYCEEHGIGYAQYQQEEFIRKEKLAKEKAEKQE